MKSRLKFTFEFLCAECGEALAGQPMEIDPAGMAICASHVHARADGILADLEPTASDEQIDRLLRAIFAEGE